MRIPTWGFGHDLGRTLNQSFGERDMFIANLFQRSLGCLGEHSRPFSFLLFFPEALLSLSLPIRSTITPEMKIDVELRSDNPTKAINMKTNLFAGDGKAKMIGA